MKFIYNQMKGEDEYFIGEDVLFVHLMFWPNWDFFVGTDMSQLENGHPNCNDKSIQLMVIVMRVGKWNNNLRMDNRGRSKEVVDLFFLLSLYILSVFERKRKSKWLRLSL